MEEKLILFKKTIKKEDGKQFDNYFVKTEDNETFTVRLTNDAKNEIIRSGLQFPLEVVLDDDNYFFTVEKYTSPEGIKLEKDVAVIQSFTSIAKADIKSETFRDKVNKRNQNVDLDKKDLPY